MREKQVRELVKEAVIQASSVFRSDQVEAYRRAIAAETDAHSRWAMEQIMENALLAEKQRVAFCQDTGTPHVLVELGTGVTFRGDLLGLINEGVADGLRALPASLIAVQGDEMVRLGQTQGAYPDPGMAAPVPIFFRSIPGEEMRLTVLILGGGPDLYAQSACIYHRNEGGWSIIKQAAQKAAEQARQMGCTPGIVFIGIGRTHAETTQLTLEAMADLDLNQQNEMERYVTDIVNTTGVGAMGLGGRTTALGTSIKIGPQKLSAGRIVCIRMGCCYDPRKAVVSIKFNS